MSSVAERLQKKPQRASQKQVRLKLVYVDFWSAFKLSFWIALAIGIVTIVVAALLWIVLNSTGVFGNLDGILQDLFNDQNFSIAASFSFGTVVGFSAIIGLVNVVIFTVLGALAAVIYNMIVKISGGLLVGFTNS